MRRGLAALLVAWAFAAATPARALVVGSSAPNGDGTYTYSYRVDNSDGELALSAWSLEFDFAAPDWLQLELASGGDVTVPGGWLAQAGTPVVGASAQDFVSLGSASDVAPGAALAGFSFVSAFAPGSVLWLEFDVEGEPSSGTTVGPSAVPEPLGLAALALALVLAFAAPARAGTLPVIQSVEVQTQPLFRGIPFRITAHASANVVQAVAMVDFRPWSPRLLRVSLQKQGGVWTGSSSVPLGTQSQPGDLARVSVVGFDAAGRRAQAAIPAAVSPLSAVFEKDEGDLYVEGGDEDDDVLVSRDANGNLFVNGGAVPIAAGPATVANTRLIDVYVRGGNDRVSFDRAHGPLPAGELYGGPGNDVLSGGSGNDNLYGEEGDDILDGGPGVDFIVAGAGDDTITCDSGDDAIEAQEGNDTLRFLGTPAGEHIVLYEDGYHVRLYRDGDPLLVDAGSIENVVIVPGGGADTVTTAYIGDTDVGSVLLDLGADGEPDEVEVEGTEGNDLFAIGGSAGTVDVRSLFLPLHIVNAEPGDHLTVRGLGGDDVIDASELDPSGIALSIDGAARTP